MGAREQEGLVAIVSQLMLAWKTIDKLLISGWLIKIVINPKKYTLLYKYI